VEARDRGQPGEPREAGRRVLTGLSRRLPIPPQVYPPSHLSHVERILIGEQTEHIACPGARLNAGAGHYPRTDPKNCSMAFQWRSAASAS
jgi:hypothetical protein